MRVWIMAGLAGVVITANVVLALHSEASSARSAPLAAATAPATSSVESNPSSDTEEAEAIPNQAVRLRIIANSDSQADQNLKRELRDQVIKEVGVRLRGATTQEQARTVLQAEVSELNTMAAEFVRDKGYAYTVKTDYGMVPFPTKMYGNRVYPAGEYEALRIVLGAGEGQNWWCVLFPPLCFVDIANGDAVQAKDMDTKPVATLQLPAADVHMAQTVQVRFGFLDLLQSLFAKIGNLLNAIFK